MSSLLVAAHDAGDFLTGVDTVTWGEAAVPLSLVGPGNGCAFSPDGQYLAVAHTNSPNLRVIRTSDWTVVSGTPALS
ncbi:hypothetical protein, partial [Thauera chlorobenzoica]